MFCRKPDLSVDLGPDFLCDVATFLGTPKKSVRPSVWPLCFFFSYIFDYWSVVPSASSFLFFRFNPSSYLRCRFSNILLHLLWQDKFCRSICKRPDIRKFLSSHNPEPICRSCTCFCQASSPSRRKLCCKQLPRQRHGGKQTGTEDQALFKNKREMVVSQTFKTHTKKL